MNTEKCQSFLENKLSRQSQKGILRQLSVPSQQLIDFSSNDYLGLAKSANLKQSVISALKNNVLTGSGGSRLLTGNSIFIEELENKLSKFHGSEAGLIFSSGYLANTGLFSCIAGRKDTVLYDEKCHASIKDGIRLGHSNAFSFKHNDLEDLNKKIKKAKGQLFIACEAIYSMDGDSTPLKELSVLSEKNNAFLIIDEAHATGICGQNGEGLTSALDINGKNIIKVITFGKAIGSQGAIVCGSQKLRDVMINYCKPFIYTTAPSFLNLIAVREAYKLLPDLDEERTHLSSLMDHLKMNLKNLKKLKFSGGSAAIVTVITFSTERAKKLAGILQQEGLDVRPIVSPTVPEGSECIRICVHAYNTLPEIKKLADLIMKFEQKL